jgi:alpha-mannosidase
VLAAAGPGAAAELARLQAAGGPARLWVPGATAAAQAFAPGADLRGDRDLPVLVVAGDDLAAAVTALAADLADAVIDASDAGEPGDDSRPDLAGHTVALLNRGTPGSLVTPDGALVISLMRSCSAWPCGVWIDGDKRTAPDGSSFAWQHWSHTFEYALAAGTGDWRSAGFPAAGQDYSRDLLACVTGRHGGQLPAAASLLRAGPATALVSALKPRGNPLSPSAQPRPGDGVTVRLRDICGGADVTAASVSLAGGVASASGASLLEEPAGPPLPLRGGAALASLPPAGTATVVLVPGTVPSPAGPGRRACAAGVHPVLAARQGPGTGGEPARRRAPVTPPDRPGRAGRPGHLRGAAAHRGLHDRARLGHRDAGRRRPGRRAGRAAVL